MTLAAASDSVERIYSEARALLLALNVPPEELRGMGIQVGEREWLRCFV